MPTRPKNYVKISPDECKGCELCTFTCPKMCIALSSDINDSGYQYAEFNDSASSCTACGFCYYICPEPDAITVCREY